MNFSFEILRTTAAELCKQAFFNKRYLIPFLLFMQEKTKGNSFVFILQTKIRTNEQGKLLPFVFFEYDL